jgi:hypothetical protein
MKIFRFASCWAVLALFLSIFTSGCSTTQVMQKATAPTEDKALVYFMRKSYPPYLRELRISVNGTVVATVANNDFVAVDVPVGENKIDLDINNSHPLNFRLPIARPERMYLMVTGDVTKTGTTQTGAGVSVQLSWNHRAIPLSRVEAESLASEFGKPLP